MKTLSESAEIVRTSPKGLVIAVDILRREEWQELCRGADFVVLVKDGRSKTIVTTSTVST